MRKLELLAPAGSLEICKGVIDAGADAVYLGGNMFGARAYAQNFDQEQLFEALDYAHLYGKKIFLTVNTLLKNEELKKYLYDYIRPLYEHGLDAAIVQDFGVTSFLHRHFPELPLHGSTQMSGTGAYGAKLMQENGISRIVTAREVSLREIRKLYDETGMEIESFIHGALCYCYSGQCLLSSLLGGRSGNRGRCAQPCRLNYDVVDTAGRIYNRKEPYPISPKDLCTLELLPEMAGAGVYSFKIEGRMKQLAYAAGVTSVYRKYLDLYEAGTAAWKVDSRDLEFLRNLGNRNGFTEGYYFRRNDRSLLSLTTSAHKSGGKEAGFQAAAPKKLPVKLCAGFETGKPSALTLVYGDITIRQQGAEVQQAQKQPLQAKDVEERLKKTGDTPFTVTEIHLTLSENAFLPVKMINELRRTALEQLLHTILQEHRRTLPISEPLADTVPYVETTPKQESICKPWSVSVLVRTKEQLTAVLRSRIADCIYLDDAFVTTFDELKELVSAIHHAEKKAVYAFPYIFRKDSADRLETQKQKLLSCQFDGVLVRSYDSLGFVKEKLPEIPVIIADQSLYTFSDEAIRAFLKNHISIVTAPYELNEKELKHRENANTEMIVYGWIPVMHTAQCIYKNFDRCKQQAKSSGGKKQTQKGASALFLQDRYFKKFLITHHCADCYNSIYNSQPLYLFAHSARIGRLGFSSLRLEFLQESGKETADILREFENAFFKDLPVDLKKRENRYTNGHFKRGVE